jgi:hypothetical protein
VKEKNARSKCAKRRRWMVRPTNMGMSKVKDRMEILICSWV